MEVKKFFHIYDVFKRKADEYNSEDIKELCLIIQDLDYTYENVKLRLSLRNKEKLENNLGDCSQYCQYYDECTECPRHELCKEEDKEYEN